MHQNLEKLSLKHKQKNENTNLPSWKGIPNALQPYILDFLPPTEALQCIITSKSSIEHFGFYIIQRLRHEKNTYTMIKVGSGYTLAMRNDGSLFAWGANSAGQLSLGHTNHQNTPQRINPSHFQGKSILSIQAGYGHTLARCADGTLFAWGRNNDGQLGLGHNNIQNFPQQIDPIHFHGKTIQSVHTGKHFTLALCSNGTLFAWGYNGYGQLGLGHANDKLTPQLISSNHFQSKTIRSIHTEANHTLALCHDGTLFAWGVNEFGQLGLGHNNHQNTPQRINPSHFQGKTIRSIHVGDNYTFALCADGSLFVWGVNEFGQLGLGHRQNQNTPQLIDSNHFQSKIIQSIHTGWYHTLVQCTDGTLFAWGRNDGGQLGLGHTNHENTPQLIDSNHFQSKTIRSIHTGGHYTLALSTDGSLFAWGWNNCGQLGLGHASIVNTPRNDGLVFAWGATSAGQLGGHTNHQNTSQRINPSHFQGKSIQSIHVEDNYTFALCTNGSLFAWGRNDDGQLGLGHNNNKHTPQPLLAPLERSFRKGHQRLNSNAFFSNKSVDPTSRFLSKYVLQPVKTDLSRTQPTTVSMKKIKQVIDKKHYFH